MNDGSSTFTKVYQFYITLDYIEPSVWRRVQVPANYTFWDLHVAIQDAMGWDDCHLHQFEIKNPETGFKEHIGIPNDGFDFMAQPLAGWESDLQEYFVDANVAGQYEYDFGDGWVHKVVLEKIVEVQSDKKYPICLDGERACPPEDCGGFPGYERIVEIIKNPHDEEFDETMAWLGGEYDPEVFASDIHFTDPKKRLKELFEED